MKFGLTAAVFSLLVPWAAGQSSTEENTWSGWGGNLFNNRHASEGSALSSSNIDSLQEHCRLEYPNGLSATPVIHDGNAYFPTWGGLFVALDFASCKVQWELNVTQLVLDYGPIEGAMVVARPVSRTSPQIDGDVLFFGTLAHSLVVAVDRHTGELLDRVNMNPNPTAMVTMSPTFYNGKLYVGTSSMENLASATIPGYPCCSFDSNMTAFTFSDSKLEVAWNRNMLPPNTNWTGASAWGSQPAIDEGRKAVLVASGNLYTAPEPYWHCWDKEPGCMPPEVLQETVLALDLDTGETKWFTRLSPLDVFNGACGKTPKPPYCPEQQGPDADFGMAPTLIPGSDSSLDAIVLGQKNGNMYSLSAATGEINWAITTSPGGMAGGLSWGLAADEERAYFTGINSGSQPWKFKTSNQTITYSGYGGVNLADGQMLWETPSPLESSALGPPTVVGDLVLVARSRAADGKGGLVFLSRTTGEVLHDMPLDNVFHGGITVYGEYVMFGTGYGSGTGSLYVLKVGGQ